jgi:hypothetical protein
MSPTAERTVHNIVVINLTYVSILPTGYHAGSYAGKRMAHAASRPECTLR